MTAHKHLKQLVRARMTKTGESYTSARRQVLRQAPTAAGDPTAKWHFPGNIPAATALRVLLAHAGVRDPHTKEPFSEAMVFGIAGGIGIGVFSFLYEKENFASFFVAGRHSWQDDLTYFEGACDRLGLKPVVKEATGAKAADKQLREALADGPCIAWVDAAHLPHLALPAMFSGGAYHVITVYRIDDAKGEALIGDRGDEPVTIPLAALAEARGRIKKQKNRLLSLPPSKGTQDLAALVEGGLRACHQGLVKQRMTNFTLEAIRVWGERMHGSKDKEAWERVFTPGKRLWRGLVSIYDFIEHYGTGSGLCRPIFADFLREAGEALKRPKLHSLAEGYAELGRAWSALADAALPDTVPPLRKAKELHARKAELLAAGDSVEEVGALWKEIADLERQAGECFPLSEAQSAALRQALQSRIMALYESEVAAHEAMGQVIS
jgi:hypothetical protein